MIDKNKIVWSDGKCICCGCMPDEFDEDYYEIITPDMIEEEDYCGIHIARLLHQRNELQAKYDKAMNIVHQVARVHITDANAHKFDFSYIELQARDLLKEVGENV